jgi:hypothetical protein
MVGYELYCWRDPKGYELIGVLPERRNNPQRVTKESILNWGQKYFGIHLNLAGMYLIEVKINMEAIRPGTKELYLYNLMRGRKGRSTNLVFSYFS